MLVATDISKSFNTRQYVRNQKFFKKRKLIRKDAVNSVSLTIKPGEIVGLLGVNGAGKTTTIKMLSTLLSPTSGSIFLDGIDAIKDPMFARSKINLINGGERNLYWRLTAHENLEYFGSLYGIGRHKLNERIKDILDIVQLTDVAHIPVEKYSKGMKQRLQIARGLINDPSYLFLDEPTLGLDVMIAKELRDYVKKIAINEGKGILLTSHYISEVEELCDRIYLLNNGEVQFEGKSEDFKARYQSNTKIYLSCLKKSKQFLLDLENHRAVKNVEINSNDEKNVVTIEIEDISLLSAIVDIAHINEVDITNLAIKEAALEESIINALKSEGGA